MNDIFDRASSGREAIDRLQAAISSMPQADLPTQHFFADGMYARFLPRPAGTLIVGKVHRKEHFYIVCCGTIRITQGDGPAREVTGPAVLVSTPGTKRAVLAMTDATCMTVHRTKKRNLDKIEQELIEPDGSALFDAHNKLKELP
ncbi:hypothetical protein [Paraburkholderia pallida]|uniref:Uncharacterized protein n=1 Tax=Paraburkholderia pallida TaxID=2547399 RepID=A0A4P7CVC4_9BURK|nr:hypothetical protein [Paraburkholderia pallida]QBQ99257.1 hypothetical protein E1956_18810 [Paraburkholderia pallida]